MLKTRCLNKCSQHLLKVIYNLNYIRKTSNIACKLNLESKFVHLDFDYNLIRFKRQIHHANVVQSLQISNINKDYSKINANLQNVFQEKENEFNNLQNILADNDALNSATPQQKSSYHKKVTLLRPIVNLIHKMRKLEEDITELNDFINELKLSDDEDKEEMVKTASADKYKAELELETTNNETIKLLTPDNEEDGCDVMIEITNGIGGQEAMTFSREIFDLYQQYGHWKGWSVDVVCDEGAEQGIPKSKIRSIILKGGLQKGILNVKGKDVYKHFKFESGVHRVQRYPPAKKSISKIHTSTCCVIILPEPEEIDIEIHQKDLAVQYKKASGAGGQHVQTTDSAVRITHLPTRISSECQINRSQRQNYQVALDVLKARLYKKKLDEQIKQEQESRKLQVQSAERSDKIRTYNFPQDRITDHRISANVHNIAEFMKGESQFEIFIFNILEKSKQERLSLLLKK
ncbi:Peptide chain release factor 1-like, mitochondrial [Nymphon striatum]|nr:Peptide chain release factor 1-like, mitochondrial [Nymphon striatum]